MAALTKPYKPWPMITPPRNNNKKKTDWVTRHLVLGRQALIRPTVCQTSAIYFKYCMFHKKRELTVKRILQQTAEFATMYNRFILNWHENECMHSYIIHREGFVSNIKSPSIGAMCGPKKANKVCCSIFLIGMKFKRRKNLF